MFVDAGLRIFDNLALFWPQFRVDSIVAPDDAYPEMTKRFHCQIELSNTPVVQKLQRIYDINSRYFLNCIFLFHTTLIQPNTVDTLVGMMNDYPICKTNEMAIMNIAFHKQWIPMQIHLPNGRFLFDWSERNGNHYTSYASLKYPRTISIDTAPPSIKSESALFGTLNEDLVVCPAFEVRDSKLAGFIHSCTLETNGTKILKRILRTLAAGLLQKLRYLIINNVGTHISVEELFAETPKNVILINSPAGSEMFEAATLREMHFFSQLHPDYKIMYLHTKGVSHVPGHPFYENIHDWTNFMLYSIVHQHESCIQILNHVDAAGSNYRHPMYDEHRNPPHFSGNFWWARASYIRSLSIHDLNGKYDAEWWLLRGNSTFAHICKSRTPERHYELPCKPEQYVAMVDARLDAWTRVLSSPVVVEYGADNTWADVTKICRERLCNGSILTIPIGDMERNAVFGDPLPGVMKAIRIGELLFPYTEPVCIPVRWC